MRHGNSAWSKGKRMCEIQDEAYSEAMDEIRRLKDLCRRAANQMEAGWEPSGNLISELRKAAQ